MSELIEKEAEAVTKPSLSSLRSVLLDFKNENVAKHEKDLHKKNNFTIKRI